MLVRVTLTFGTTAPEASVTVPVSAPVPADWASKDRPNSARTTTANSIFLDFIHPPVVCPPPPHTPGCRITSDCMIDSAEQESKQRQISKGPVSVPVALEQMTFGPFRVEVAKARLLRDGAELELRPQAFHVLRALILNRGQCLGYDR